MRNLLSFLSFAFLIFSCNLPNETELMGIPLDFPGNWVLVETSISIGAEPEVKKVVNGGHYNFDPDGSFTSFDLDACGRGTYKLGNDQLILTYACDSKDHPNPFSFAMTLEKDHLKLSPLSIMCIEGCSYLFKKVK